MLIPTRFYSALVLLALGAVMCASAQASASNRSAAAVQQPDESSYPEQAYLSPDRYTNQYFGFTFELPAETHLRPIPLPASRNGNIQVLELAGPPPADAAISIQAIPTASGSKQDAKAYLRQELDQELYRGVEELRGLSKANIANHQFYLYETRRGIDQHVMLATTIGDYILHIVVAAHDEKTVKRLENAIQHLTFFSPPDLKQFVQADSKPYDGPSISSHRLALLEENPPAKQIAAGKVNGDFYENAQLGFAYRVPQGWLLKSEGLVQPAIESYKAKLDFGRPRMARAERILLDACSRTLFSAWAKPPAADGLISYDDFGEVTVTAISMACFPNLKFPKQGSDVQQFKDFVAQFALTHPIVEDMGNGKVFTENGIVFIYLHGTVAFQIPDDQLSRRLSLAMAITERRGYLLTWFFAAPHDAELLGLTNERAVFDNGPAVNVATAKGSESGEAAAEPASSGTNAQPPVSSSSPAEASAAPSAHNSDTSATNDEQQQSSGADHPSLLRPGENMQTQQGKGVTIKPK